MSHLKDNGALLVYYTTFLECLNSLFIQAKISDGNFKIDGSRNASDALKLAREIIKKFGGILTKVSDIMGIAEEN